METIKYFESQQENEIISLIIRKHWVVLVLPLLTVALLYSIGFFAIFFLPIFLPSLLEGFAYNYFVLMTSSLFLITTNVLFYVVLIYYLNVGLITNEHIVEIVQERLFSRKVSELELGKIQDVAAKQSGVAQTFLNYGNVEIQTAGELPNFMFKKVPKPNECAQNIVKLTEDFSRRHGIRTEVGDVNANVIKANAPVDKKTEK